MGSWLVRAKPSVGSPTSPSGCEPEPQELHLAFVSSLMALKSWEKRLAHADSLSSAIQRGWSPSIFIRTRHTWSQPFVT